MHVVWTDELLDEWERVIVREHQRSAASAASIGAAIREAFDDLRIDPAAYRHLIETMPGADLDDHVHAARRWRRTSTHSSPTTRPRLRSRKRSGSPSGCDTQRVLDVGDAYTELFGQLVDRLTGQESRDHVVDARSTMNEDRATERAHRIADDIAPIARHTEQGGVAVSAELDPLQLLAHHIDEDTLSVANNDTSGLTGP